MTYTLIGYQKLDFSGTDGNRVQGTNVWLGSDIDPRYGGGKKVHKTFVSSRIFSGEFVEGCKYDAEYDPEKRNTKGEARLVKFCETAF